MAQTLIDAHLTVPNGSYGTLYSQPVGSKAFISSLVVCNTTAGILNVSIQVQEIDASVTQLVTLQMVAALDTNSYGSETEIKLTPIVLSGGASLKIQGSGAGLVARCGGISQ